jgi:menaquinone-9 beta-reductase
VAVVTAVALRSPPRFDVAIVGGGPAGTSTALHLVRAYGVVPERVVMLEKLRHPREKPCGGAISAWGLRALAALGIDVDVPQVPIRGVRVLLGDGVGQSSAEGIGVVVRRSEFDAILWREAARLGVRALDGQAVVDMEKDGDGWALSTPGGVIRARFVAACDGAGSRVRRLLGVPEAARKGHLYVLETPIEAGDAGPASGQCDFDLTPARHGLEGYYWDFPATIDGRPHVSRGIYHANLTPRHDVRAALARALGARGIDIAKVNLKPFSTRPFVRGATLCKDGVLMVGEAAGIDATTGEGIAQAILMGAMAARHLARALGGGARELEGYARELRASRVAKHLLQSAWIARRVYGPYGEPWRRYLVRSARARAVGVQWYCGEPIPFELRARLALDVVGALARG